MVFNRESSISGEICIVFTSDEHLLEMNREYLGHDFYTDVLTFDYSQGSIISGDIVVSIDRILDNSKEFGVNFSDELDRVIIHGVLHLLGYKDATPAQIMEMRSKESYYLDLR